MERIIKHAGAVGIIAKFRYQWVSHETEISSLNSIPPPRHSLLFHHQNTLKIHLKNTRSILHVLFAFQPNLIRLLLWITRLEFLLDGIKNIRPHPPGGDSGIHHHHPLFTRGNSLLFDALAPSLLVLLQPVSSQVLSVVCPLLVCPRVLIRKLSYWNIKAYPEWAFPWVNISEVLLPIPGFIAF